jgi:hypothetical protein
MLNRAAGWSGAGPGADWVTGPENEASRNSVDVKVRIVSGGGG